MTQSLALIVTRSCNLECVYCPVDKCDTDLSVADALRAVDEFAENGGGLIRLTGGEPTVNWTTVEAVIGRVEQLRETGREVEVELCTNGTLLDPGRIAFLDRTWLQVVLSLDGVPDTQASSGRRSVGCLSDLLRLDGFTVTQTIAPEQAGRVLDNFLHLFEGGIRNFNFLPVYYVRWTPAQAAALEEGLDAVAEFLVPRLGRGRVSVRNLTRSGTVPLFNDDLTMDADGTMYRTNMVLADSVTAPLLQELRVIDGRMPPLSDDLRRKLENLLDPAVRRSLGRVDRILSRFVRKLHAGSPGRPVTPARASRTRRPQRLEFHISYECTNRCVFCSEAERLEKWKGCAVSAMEVRRTLLSHARAGGTHVNFTGGEPTMHPAFLYGLDLAWSLGMRIYVGTNGANLAKPSFAKRALPYIDELSLSLHGSHAQLHDNATKRNGSFDGLMQTRRNVADIRPDIDLFVNAVATTQNFDDLPNVIALCSKLEIPHLLVSSVAPEGRALENYEALAVKLARWREASPVLSRIAYREGVTIRFFGLPLCVLGDARMKSNDLYYDPRVTVERAAGARGTIRLSNVATKKPRRGRKKTARCRGCTMRELCGGVFSAYVELFGESEIEAIRG